MAKQKDYHHCSRDPGDHHQERCPGNPGSVVKAPKSREA